MQYTSVKLQKKAFASVNKKGKIYVITTEAELMYYVNLKTMFLFRSLSTRYIFNERQQHVFIIAYCIIIVNAIIVKM